MPETKVVTLRLDTALLKLIDEMAEVRGRQLYEDPTVPFHSSFTGEKKADTIRWLLYLGIHHEKRRQFALWKKTTHGKQKGGAK